MRFDKDSLSDFNTTRSLEWLETNGNGGYASGTVSGANSRRYHGLLVAALRPPVERTVMLSKLDETVIVHKDGVASHYELGANQYPGVIHPAGFRFLESFDHDLFPVFRFKAGGILLEKTIASVHGDNTTLVIYEVLEAPSEFTMELLPLCSSRDYHSLSHANDAIGRQYVFDEGLFRTLNYHGGAELFICVPRSEFIDQPEWYRNFEYSVEQERGLDFHEDLFSHGKFKVQLKKGQKLGVVISTHEPDRRDALRLFQTELRRREKLVVSYPEMCTLRTLTLAADQFIVRREAFVSILAGYHWFTDWGRDSMIALPGLCLATGKFREAKQILQLYASSVSEGMLPNRFPDRGEVPEYNTIDATLWFFHAADEYYRYTDDKAFMRTMLPVLDSIAEWHYRGTRYNIHVDLDDNLLVGGVEGVQLTWMDAKVGDWVVTPRRGKVVEINALWYNALMTLELLHRELDDTHRAKYYQGLAAQVKKSFGDTFWDGEGEYLFDFVDEGERNNDFRPNQLFAISLPYPLVDGDRARLIFDQITSKLLTPVGLRSLAPDVPSFKPVYSGDVWSRDGAYHQGTVWSYLIGPYVDALFAMYPDTAKETATRIIQGFVGHLATGGVGSVSEIFDGVAPFEPRGCIAQAWGVAEVLRIIVQYELKID